VKSTKSHNLNFQTRQTEQQNNEEK